MIKRTIYLALSLCLIFFTACSDDDNGSQDPNDNSNNDGTGTANVTLSGDLNKTLGDYATWEITDDQLLRIRIGDQFPDNIVMNYSLNSDNVQDFNADTYQAVSATGTGMGSDTMAFQYNNDGTYFPDSGTITITSVDGNTIEGEINVIMSPVNGQSTTDVIGTFSAEAL